MGMYDPFRTSAQRVQTLWSALNLLSMLSIWRAGPPARERRSLDLIALTTRSLTSELETLVCPYWLPMHLYLAPVANLLRAWPPAAGANGL